MKSNSTSDPETSTQQNTWEAITQNQVSKETLVADYLTGQLQIAALCDPLCSFSAEQIDAAISKVIHALLAASVSSIRQMLRHCNTLVDVTASNIPQFSNFASAAIFVPELLVKSQKPISYQELGSILFSETKSETAAIKYGENHGKLAALLDLAAIERFDGKNCFSATLLAHKFCELNQDEKLELLTRLCYRIPLVQHASIADDPYCELEMILTSTLSNSTVLRRRANANEVLAFALED